MFFVFANYAYEAYGGISDLQLVCHTLPAAKKAAIKLDMNQDIHVFDADKLVTYNLISKQVEPFVNGKYKRKCSWKKIKLPDSCIQSTTV